MIKTYSPKANEVEREWILIDAEDQILGRLATQVATILRGKHKPEFAHHIDVGDFVVVINVDKIRVTGNRLDQKIYYRHSGYPGGLTGITLRKMMEKSPERVIEKAVWGMLPKNRLGRKLLKKLKIYAGPEHPHAAQQPRQIEL